MLLVVHPRKGVDESRVPGKLDIKGTGAVSDLADNCFCIWRNKAKEEEIQKSLNKGMQPSDEWLGKYDCLWICDKQRNGDWEGVVSLCFDKESYQFLNYAKQRPVQFVNYSNIRETSLC